MKIEDIIRKRIKIAEKRILELIKSGDIQLSHKEIFYTQ